MSGDNLALPDPASERQSLGRLPIARGVASISTRPGSRENVSHPAFALDFANVARISLSLAGGVVAAYLPHGQQAFAGRERVPSWQRTRVLEGGMSAAARLASAHGPDVDVPALAVCLLGRYLPQRIFGKGPPSRGHCSPGDTEWGSRDTSLPSASRKAGGCFCGATGGRKGSGYSDSGLGKFSAGSFVGGGRGSGAGSAG